LYIKKIRAHLLPSSKKTSMKCYYEVKMAGLELGKVKAILPDEYSFIDVDDKRYLMYECQDITKREDMEFDLQRECDRIYYITGIYINPVLLHIEDERGGGSAFANRSVFVEVYQDIPPDIKAQDWSGEPKLMVQLSLWRLANIGNLHIRPKINLLFQIIEIEYPNTKDHDIYSQYLDVTTEPSPLLECKLLRHIASHGLNISLVGSMKNYCDKHFINPNPITLNEQKAVQKLLKDKIGLIESEAKKVIDRKLSK
jgi:hypothetical protein